MPFSTRNSGGRAQPASSAISSRNRGSAGGGSIVSTFTHVPGLEATEGEDSRGLEGSTSTTGCNPRPRPETPVHTEFGHLLTFSLQVLEQVPQLALLGQAFAIANMLHTDV